jgi:hypothetical protein|tara:strand:- start:788 stop:892 length:105 start_codon:yes stop_codon:yes gene_type:complete
MKAFRAMTAMVSGGIQAPTNAQVSCVCKRIDGTQ